MKKISLLLTTFCLAFTFLFLSGCVKDTVQKSYKYTLFRPVYTTTAAARANIKSNTPIAIEQPGKLLIKGGYIFLNEVEKGIHIIDNRDPAAPRNVAFIDIPGNVDLAVKGNTLYADLYTDLVAIDITNPLAATVTKVVENVFPHRYFSMYSNIDTTMVIASWVKTDTTITEKYSANGGGLDWGGGIVFENCITCSFSYASTPAAAVSPVGTGGSMARFTIVNDRLYTVGMQELNVFDIATATTPSFISSKIIGFGIETIFPFKDKLFIGSTNGMFIYGISNPDQPAQVSQFTHVQSCDPVIADADHAFVTLRSGTLCNGFTNQLDVLDIKNLLQPSLVKTYPMTHPFGLSKDANLLFICDGEAGLKVYDAAKPDALQLLQTITGIETYDVIAANGLAIVIAKDGLYQFDYSDRNNIQQLSKLTIR